MAQILYDDLDAEHIMPVAKRPKELAHSIVSHALFGLAKASAARVCENPVEVYSVVILSALWLEAYLNQICVPLPRGKHRLPKKLVSLKQKYRDLELGKGTLLDRIDLIFVTLTGKPPARGDRIYQRVDTLILIRNALVHMQPQTFLGFPTRAKVAPPIYVDDPLRIAKRLVGERLIPKDSLNVGTSNPNRPWNTSFLHTKSAMWALDAAQVMAVAIADRFPRGHWRYMAHLQNPARPEFLHLGEPLD